MYQACYPLGACICKLSIIVLHAVDRFICRVGTEVTVSVLFSQDHKKCLLLYESVHNVIYSLCAIVFKISKRHLTFSKRLGRHLISLKKFILNEIRIITLSANCNS